MENTIFQKLRVVSSLSNSERKVARGLLGKALGVEESIAEIEGHCWGKVIGIYSESENRKIKANRHKKLSILKMAKKGRQLVVKSWRDWTSEPPVVGGSARNCASCLSVSVTWVRSSSLSEMGCAFLLPLNCSVTGHSVTVSWIPASELLMKYWVVLDLEWSHSGPLRASLCGRTVNCS